MKSFYDSFHDTLAEIGNGQGWHVVVEWQDGSLGHQIEVLFRCPHGQIQETMLSGAALISAISPEMLAEITFNDAYRRCGFYHGPKPSPEPDYQGIKEVLEIWNGEPVALEDVKKVVSSSSEPSVLDELSKLFPDLREAVVVCPATDLCRQGWKGRELSLWRVIAHLNDSHCWSREDIADWLVTLDLDLTLGALSQGD